MVEQSPTERAALAQQERWLSGISDLSWDEIVADGGVMAWMVIQQEARTVQLPIVRAALATQAAQPAEADGVERALLDELATYLPSIRVFLTSKERPHEAGVKWHDDLVAKINAAREARHV